MCSGLCGLSQRSPQRLLARAQFAGTLVVAWRDTCPSSQMRGRRKALHVNADLGQQFGQHIAMMRVDAAFQRFGQFDLLATQAIFRQVRRERSQLPNERAKARDFLFVLITLHAHFARKSRTIRTRPPYILTRLRIMMLPEFRQRIQEGASESIEILSV